MENDRPVPGTAPASLITAVDAAFPHGTNPEIIAEMGLRFANPDVMAQVLMQNMSDPDEFTYMERIFWSNIAFSMGSDWIGKFRRISAFMSAVDKA